MTREEALKLIKEDLFDGDHKEALEILIPELKKSEDEKMAESIIAVINLYYGNPLEDEAKEMIAWVEKQVYKQKDNSVINENNKKLSKPRFKIGDWIVCYGINTGLIVNIHNDLSSYEIEFVNGDKALPHIDYIDKLFHIWNISDAKDGDILADEGNAFIFKGLTDPKNPGSPVAYCGIDCNNDFSISSGKNWWCSSKNVTPATKKQSHFLFKKMNDKGYIWFSNKKELLRMDKKLPNKN